MMWWSIWWVWLAAALVLAILEVVVPAYIFMGFAIGAALTGWRWPSGYSPPPAFR